MGVSGQLPRPPLSSPNPCLRCSATLAVKHSAPQNKVAVSPSRLLQVDSCWPQHKLWEEALPN